MPRTRSIAWSQLKLGIIGVVALVLALMLIVAVGGEGGFFSQRYPLKARFAHAHGLTGGALVRVNGKDIGTVTTVDLAGAEIEVSMQVRAEARPLITDQSSATIGSLSLLGESMVDIKGAPAGTPLPDWGYVRTLEPTLIDDVTTRASEGLESFNALLADLRKGQGTAGKLITDEALYNEMKGLMTAAANVSRSLEQGRGTLGGLIQDPAAYTALKASLANLEAVTARINTGQGALGRFLNDEAMGRSLAGTMGNMEQVTGRLTRGEGTAGKLLTDQELYNRLNSMTSRIDAVAEGLNAGRGTAGQLLHDRQLYENMNLAVSEMRGLLADIRRDPRKFLRVNVSIF